MHCAWRRRCECPAPDDRLRAARARPGRHRPGAALRLPLVLGLRPEPGTLPPRPAAVGAHRPLRPRLGAHGLRGGGARPEVAAHPRCVGPDRGLRAPGERHLPRLHLRGAPPPLLRDGSDHRQHQSPASGAGGARAPERAPHPAEDRRSAARILRRPGDDGRAGGDPGCPARRRAARLPRRRRAGRLHRGVQAAPHPGGSPGGQHHSARRSLGSCCSRWPSCWRAHPTSCPRPRSREPRLPRPGDEPRRVVPLVLAACATARRAG